MKPEVYGALALACREINKAAGWKYRNKKRQRKHQEKVQKHLTRALRYEHDTSSKTE